MQHDLFEARPTYFATLDDLIAHMMKMEDDPLFPAGTSMVIYRGNPAAKILIVGEAPGGEEDRVGKPFMGRAGQLLDKVLDAGGFNSEEDVFLTNAVFRLPPGVGGKTFRKPTNDEIAFYKPYLLEVIRLVDPKIVLLTGNVPTQVILGKTGITKLRGQWIEWEGRWVMPMFHPSYLLRNATRAPTGPKALTWQDIQEVRRKYDELVGE